MNRRHFRRFLPIVLLVIGLGTGVPSPAYGAEPRGEAGQEAVRLSVRSSPGAAYRLEEKWADPLLLRALREPSARASERAAERGASPELTDIYVEWAAPGGTSRTYRMEPNGQLYSEESDEAVRLPEPAAGRLLREAARLSRAHYGELADWSEASRLLPKLAVFTVVDLETGLHFRVQRRAGRDHADVQPVAKEDTQVMKTIYEDRWSWRRRAVLVQAEGRQLAASMNGMPHGGDGIPGNGFNGHFCIHFLNSSTHKSAAPDLAHQLMVFKAAGQPRALLQRLTPLEQAESFAAAIHEQDREWVRLLLERVDSSRSQQLQERMARVLAIRPTAPERLHAGEDVLTAEVALAVNCQRSGGGRRTETLRFEFARSSPSSPWRITRLEGEL
ncbi:hypothetical protein [Cohnella fermenti]|uniref:Uncharacterized protein n=1 Tax=Cohnella fermenti TaxID=2565925 RepID=A0A4S4BI62_9BACL|nr:hypothetical protein [Cohnella fermenti]THF74048.1 hypothetical protein E6C55_26520 [Cohnella fermenti]